MVWLLTLLLLVAVLAFVGYPLLRPAAAEPDGAATAPGTAAARRGQHEQLLGERENALATLKDLELEHAIGNLSDADYDVLRAAQRHKAVAILRELDRADEACAAPAGAQASALDSPALDARLEEEIARARRRLEGAHPAVAAPADAAPTCAACGAPHAPDARFCSECGRPFGEAVRCPACGAAASPRARFCAQCGAPFMPEMHDT